MDIIRITNIQNRLMEIAEDINKLEVLEDLHFHTEDLGEATDMQGYVTGWREALEGQATELIRELLRLNS